MVIVSDDLRELIANSNVVPIGCYDTFSVTLSLGPTLIKYLTDNVEFIDYKGVIPQEVIDATIVDDYLTLNPKECVLACSNEYVKMPKGYIGFLQTKGSLARLFVMAHCCDGQVEPGYEGRVTFELTNLGEAPVRIHFGQPIAQMFIHQVSSDKDAYSGHYSHSDLPTYCKINEEIK